MRIIHYFSKLFTSLLRRLASSDSASYSSSGPEDDPGCAEDSIHIHNGCKQGEDNDACWTCEEAQSWICLEDTGLMYCPEVAESGREARPSGAAGACTFLEARGNGAFFRENANCGDPPGTLRVPSG